MYITNKEEFFDKTTLRHRKRKGPQNEIANAELQRVTEQGVLRSRQRCVSILSYESATQVPNRDKYMNLSCITSNIHNALLIRIHAHGYADAAHPIPTRRRSIGVGALRPPHVIERGVSCWISSPSPYLFLPFVCPAHVTSSHAQCQSVRRMGLRFGISDMIDCYVCIVWFILWIWIKFVNRILGYVNSINQ